MNIDNSTILVLIVIIAIISYFIVFILGLIIGLFWVNRGVSNTVNTFRRSGSNNPSSTNSSITIDTSKVVTDIKTDGMEKKYQSIGDTKQSSENISNSIAKLKNMKR